MESESAIEVWSLSDMPFDDSSVRAARGNRLRFGAWGLAQGCFPQHGRLVVNLHTHLLPVALPLVHRGARLVHFLVGIEAWKPLSRLQALVLRRATRLVAISRHSEREFRRANPSFADADVAICHPGLPDLGEKEESIDGTYGLIVGRMSKEERYKGHDLLLEIWGEVMNRHPGAELAVVGDGDDRPRLEKRAESLGLGNAVRFLGRVRDQELDHLYRGSSFFVMPSRQEGFGFVFLEAMRAGKACIAAHGAASEIIDDGVTGLIVDPDDRGSVIEAIRRLWADPGLRKGMGSRGKARFLSHFTRKRFALRFRDCVGKI
jgi:glycosyltransferase involved in cell wall biosynthesis